MPRLTPEQRARMMATKETREQKILRLDREEEEFQAYLLTLSPEKQKEEKQRRYRQRYKDRKRFEEKVLGIPQHKVRYTKRGTPRQT